MLPAHSISLERHNAEISENQRFWDRKPILRRIYRRFHEEIAKHIDPSLPGAIVELGSGIGNIKEVIPNCLRTDLFSNPWLDQRETAYSLSFRDGSVSNIILFDVFHHLRYPGQALRECRRVLVPGGRIIIFDPYISLLGSVVYGLGHHEPVAYFDPITWDAPPGWDPERDDSYYAAQGNATRVFADIFRRTETARLRGFTVQSVRKFAAISYVGSGGYRGPQLYPDRLLPFMQYLDRILDAAPLLFGTRLLVELRKNRLTQL